VNAPLAECASVLVFPLMLGCMRVFAHPDLTTVRRTYVLLLLVCVSSARDLVCPARYLTVQASSLCRSVGAVS